MTGAKRLKQFEQSIIAQNTQLLLDFINKSHGPLHGSDTTILVPTFFNVNGCFLVKFSSLLGQQGVIAGN